MEKEISNVINYYAGAPVPKYLNKIPKDVELCTLEYCGKMEDYYDIDCGENNFYIIDYIFLNEYKNLKSISLYNWGDYLPKDNLVNILQNNILKFPNELKVLCIFRKYYSIFSNLSFLNEYKNLEFLIINTIFTKTNIEYLPENIKYFEYRFNIEDVDNIIEALNIKFKNLKRIYLLKHYNEKNEIKYNELVNKLKEKNVEIITEYDHFDIEDFIIDLFENENTKINYIDIEKDDI